MKTIIFRNISFCAAIWLLAACSRDLQPQAMDDDDSGDTPVQIVVSRSTMAGDDGETDTKFTSGCLIGISVGSSAECQNMRYKYLSSGSALEAVDNKVYWGRGVNSMPVKAYYPYQNGGNYNTASVEANQSTEENYYKSDALFATGTISRENMTLPVFTHRMAKVIFLFSKDVSDVEILNQSLNTGNVTGNSKITAYKETARKWKACIVPGQTVLNVTCKKDGEVFNVTFTSSSGMLAGMQYTFNVSTWNKLKDLSKGNVSIYDDDSYYIKQSTESGSNRISIIGSPTVYIENLNVKAGVAVEIISGTPTIIVAGDNTLRSTDFGASAIQLTNGNVVIKGSGSLTVIGADHGVGIGTIYTASTGCNITIEDCTIKAIASNGESSSDAAGIGSRGFAGCGNITIKNAMITSRGAYGGAGIGSGQSGSCGNIDITLRNGDSKEAFLNRITAGDGAAKVGAGKSGSVGSVTWRNSNGTVIP